MTQSQTLPAWLDKLGDWNPQLLREIKGRLSWRSVLLTVALVTIVQVLLMMNYIQQLPNEVATNFNASYCISSLNKYDPVRTWANCGGINWQRWWRDIFDVQNTWNAFFIYLPAVYFLIADVNQEIQRGTINFLRLSPRSSQNLLLGKLLGVPCLSYLALILVIPLHLVCGTMAGISPSFFFSYYSTFLLFGAILMMGALFISLSHRNIETKSSSIGFFSKIFLGLFIVGMVAVPLISYWNNLVLWLPYLRPDSKPRYILSWFFIEFRRDLMINHLFTFINLAIVIVFFWRMLQRIFQCPTATLISKSHSYLLVPYVTLLIIGFQEVSGSRGPYRAGDDATMIRESLTTQLLLLWPYIGLILALLTTRQTWFEWIHHRKAARLESRHSSRTNKSVLWDLLLGAKSPGLTAIGVNLLMIVGIIAIRLILSDASRSSHGNVLVCVHLVLMVTLVSIYALLIQWMLMLKTRKRWTWAIGSLFFAVGLPLVVGWYFTFFNRSPIGTVLLLCSPFYQLGTSDIIMSYDFSNLTIALLIQAIAILFLSSRVWSEYRKMLRS